MRFEFFTKIPPKDKKNLENGTFFNLTEKITKKT